MHQDILAHDRRVWRPPFSRTAAVDGGLQQVKAGAEPTNLSSPKRRLWTSSKPPPTAVVHNDDSRYYHLARTRTLCGRLWCVVPTFTASDALAGAMSLRLL